MEELMTVGASAAVQYGDLTVAALGLGTVFFGLICIIFICSIFGKIFASTSKKAGADVKQTAPVQASNELSAEEKGAVVAAVSAVIAEELGTDVSALRIHSFKKI